MPHPDHHLYPSCQHPSCTCGWKNDLERKDSLLRVGDKNQQARRKINRLIQPPLPSIFHCFESIPPWSPMKTLSQQKFIVNFLPKMVSKTTFPFGLADRKGTFLAVLRCPLAFYFLYTIQFPLNVQFLPCTTRHRFSLYLLHLSALPFIAIFHKIQENLPKNPLMMELLPA